MVMTFSSSLIGHGLQLYFPFGNSPLRSSTSTSAEVSHMLEVASSSRVTRAVGSRGSAMMLPQVCRWDQLWQWSQHKAALILLEAGRKGESGGGPGSESGGWKQELYAC